MGPTIEFIHRKNRRINVRRKSNGIEFTGREVDVRRSSIEIIAVGLQPFIVIQFYPHGF